MIDVMNDDDISDDEPITLADIWDGKPSVLTLAPGSPEWRQAFRQLQEYAAAMNAEWGRDDADGAHDASNELLAKIVKTSIDNPETISNTIHAAAYLVIGALREVVRIAQVVQPPEQAVAELLAELPILDRWLSQRTLRLVLPEE